MTAIGTSSRSPRARRLWRARRRFVTRRLTWLADGRTKKLAGSAEGTVARDAATIGDGSIKGCVGMSCLTRADSTCVVGCEGLAIGAIANVTAPGSAGSHGADADRETRDDPAHGSTP